MKAIKDFNTPTFEEIEVGMDVYNWREHRIQTVLHNTGNTLLCTGEDITDLKDWRLFGFKCGKHVNARSFYFYLRDDWVWQVNQEAREMGAFVHKAYASKFNKVGLNV